MKRRLINDEANLVNYVQIDIPTNLKGFADNLRLLNEVPLTYLLSDISDLNKESIRFFILDINWTDALLDGAFSIGRVCENDCQADDHMLKAATAERNYMDTPRMRRMHPNHKNDFDTKNVNSSGETYAQVSGFLMRSQLVRKMKGLNVYGYDKKGAPKTDFDDGTTLNILRMDAIGDDVLLCLFSGEIYEVIIAEPQTGLRFGSSAEFAGESKVKRTIDLRSALDSDDLGKRIGSLSIDDYVDNVGRLKAKKLAEKIEEQLKKSHSLGVEKITPSRFTFELIAVACRARFTANRKGEENG